MRSFNRNFVNSTPIPSPRTIFRTIPSACTLPPGTSNASLSFVPTGGGLGTEMNSPPLPSVRTREKSCRSPPCQTTRMPFGNEMRAYLRFWRMASTVMWCTPPNVTEVLARFAKIFDPGQQCCMGVWINVQKFEAPPQLRFLHTHHCQHLYLLAFVGERSADAGANLYGAARTQNILQEKDLRSPRSCDSRISIRASPRRLRKDSESNTAGYAHQVLWRVAAARFHAAITSYRKLGLTSHVVTFHTEGVAQVL